MSVYVDNMEAQYRGMVMCHMLADTHEELMAMAERIGVKAKWIQHEGTAREHFDIAKSKRALAVESGAIEIGPYEVVEIIRAKRIEVRA